MVLLLDAYHLGDPLFLTGLARDLAARGAGGVLVHGSAERGERALEALGVVPEAQDGAWLVHADRERQTVERAARDLNRELVHEMNEAGVPAVGLLGSDRGLLRAGAGGLEAGRTAWLQTLVDQGVVAVVASLLDGPEGTTERPPAAAAAALAGALDAPVLLLVRGAPPADEGAPLPADLLADPGAAAWLLDAGASVRGLGRGDLRGGEAASRPVCAA